jgi:multidrug efflux pump subunit AcrA (membrane-fusion protein)
MLNNKNLFYFFFLCGVISLVTLGCSKDQGMEKDAVQNIPVRVEEVRLQDLNNSLEYVGSIRAEDEALVYPKVSGKIIEKAKQEGEIVGKQEVIAYIDRDEVGAKFQKAPVESPIAGVVGRVYVDIGTNVLPQTPVALVVNMDMMKINLDIPDKFIPKIYLGQEARIRVDAYPTEQFIGKVTKVSPIVNIENRSAPVEITLDNSGHRLQSGMFARVYLIIEKHSGIPVILKEAILGKSPDNYVYVVESGKSVVRKIEVGLHDGPYYEVSQGLKSGDLVVVMGQQRLYDGALVTLERQDIQENK